MPHMDPAPEPHALNMRSGAMEAPMPDLVTEPTELPCGTLFVAMVGVRLKLAFCTTCAVRVLVLAHGPSF